MIHNPDTARLDAARAVLSAARSTVAASSAPAMPGLQSQSVIDFAQFSAAVLGALYVGDTIPSDNDAVEMCETAQETLTEKVLPGLRAKAKAEAEAAAKASAEGTSTQETAEQETAEDDDEEEWEEDE